ncbi:ASCH domain-containing protein [Aeromicrobium sp. 636]|uniref:ASCH domain-containing protein n=1 Tax=Aeromicrobium senzhongii TaxID=2663859 RepID=A0A8I0EUN6_9ACTN|nr:MULTISPECIES: ASCH domain-containing protein [Aeromicrobium]MBC9225671.1 ASCH domain-containing protein [Aeromicrobium senzhongii]MCQ3997780.1 ASCH domain-containing protein [Aeromicrobium sp. 636]
MSWPRVGALRGLELGTPGRMRERLNGLVLTGQKQATAGLLTEYGAEGEELEHIGERLALLDDLGDQIATVEITDLQIVPFIDVPWEFAAAEGEGDADIEEWRDGHRAFWAAEGAAVEDDTPIVCLRFVLV